MTEKTLDLSGVEPELNVSQKNNLAVISLQECGGPAHARRRTGNAIRLGMTLADARLLLQHLQAADESGLLPKATATVAGIKIPGLKDRN